MALPLYLAMTAAEMQGNAEFPNYFAYMACHFSPYGSGLCNFPHSLPAGSMLILNDRIPYRGHDIHLITAQLTELVDRFSCSTVLLDFQQAVTEETATLAKLLVATLPCPVGISNEHATKLDCPIFLPPVPPDIPLADYLTPWRDREIWLDISAEGTVLTLTETGCRHSVLPYPHHSGGFSHEALHTHYIITQTGNCPQFQLFRTKEDIQALLQEAEALDVGLCVGLWQELYTP